MIIVHSQWLASPYPPSQLFTIFSKCKAWSYIILSTTITNWAANIQGKKKQRNHNVTHNSCLPRPTILKSSGDDFLRRRSYSSPVTSLNYHAILCEFLQVIQGINFTVPCGINTDDVELEIATCTVFPITYLVSTNNSILQVLLWSLNRIWKNTL